MLLVSTPGQAVFTCILFRWIRRGPRCTYVIDAMNYSKRPLCRALELLLSRSSKRQKESTVTILHRTNVMRGDLPERLVYVRTLYYCS